MTLGCPNRLPQRGFTLVELLVVIVIVAALASVTVTVANRSIQSARAASCMSNVRQIGNLMNGYAAENNGYYPEAGKPNGYITRLCEAMFPNSFPAGADASDSDRQNFFRTQSGSIFICPHDKQGLKNFEKSYLVNGRITGVVNTVEPKAYVGGGTNAFTPKPISRVYDPARTLLLIEGWEKQNRLWNANDVRYTSDDDADANFDAHKGGRHYLFVDGHVEWLTKDPGRGSAADEDLYYRGKEPGA